VDPSAVGRELARRFGGEGGRVDVRGLAAAMGVAVEERAAPPPAQPGLRSEYQPDPPRIILYRNPIDELAEALRGIERLQTGSWGLDEVHAAHELFHHLERVEGVEGLSVGEAEEAAHAFVRELLGLGFDPRELSAGEG